MKTNKALVRFEIPDTDESVSMYFTLDGEDLDYDVKSTEKLENAPMNEHLALMLAGMFISSLNGGVMPEANSENKVEPTAIPKKKVILS